HQPTLAIAGIVECDAAGCNWRRIFLAGNWGKLDKIVPGADTLRQVDGWSTALARAAEQWQRMRCVPAKTGGARSGWLEGSRGATSRARCANYSSEWAVGEPAAMSVKPGLEGNSATSLAPAL